MDIAKPVLACIAWGESTSEFPDEVELSLGITQDTTTGTNMHIPHEGEEVQARFPSPFKQRLCCFKINL
jgi:hypothetical protein